MKPFAGHETHWAASPGVLLKDWGEASALVYDPAMARTHLISAAAAVVLHAVAAAPRSASALAALFEDGAAAEAGAAPAGENALDELLDGLLRSGLLTRRE